MGVGSETMEPQGNSKSHNGVQNPRTWGWTNTINTRDCLVAMSPGVW